MPPRAFAFSIPHIREDIVSHLSSKDLFNCITVSREFYQLFSPYTWRRVVITGPGQCSSLHDVVLASDGKALVENQHKIQVLASNQDEIWDLFVKNIDPPSDAAAGSAVEPISRFTLCAPFTNLVGLQAAPSTLEDGVSRINPDFVSQVYGLVEHLPSLHTLCLGRFYSSDNMQIPLLAKIIRGHHSLKALVLRVDVFLLSLYRKLLWSCWNLEKLQVTARFYDIDRPDKAVENRLSEEEEQELDAWIAENRPEVYTAAKEEKDGDKDDTKVPFRLKEFTFYIDPSNGELGVTLPFLRRCRWLRKLRPPHIDAEELLKITGSDVQAIWRDLEHLDMRNLNRNWQLVSLSAVTMLFCLGNGLRSLVLTPNHYEQSGTLTEPTQSLLTVLLWHVKSLVHLKLEGCSRFTGADLQSVLSSCPNLKSLEALTGTANLPQLDGVRIEDPILQSSDVETADDWVCLGLERLRLRIRNGDMSTIEHRRKRAGIPRAIFSRIQSLEKLRDLQLCLVRSTWEDSGLPEASEDLPEWESSVEKCGTENLNDALEALNSMNSLEGLWLRDMTDYINLDLTKDKMEWAKLKWAHYS
ncbi:hypothetical protein MVEG_04218 [Podila verticillata NRRL 6337]|nr:hypothetical protein MVEG_04218 [Podila verticillata NRRL 6337]